MRIFKLSFNLKYLMHKQLIISLKYILYAVLYKPDICTVIDVYIVKLDKSLCEFFDSENNLYKLINVLINV